MPLGDGTSTDYPGALDTAQTFTNGASPVTDDSTRIDAELVNDLLGAVIAIQTELGIDPAGSYSDVKTRLNTYLPLSGAAFTTGSILYADANGRLTQNNTGVRWDNGVVLGQPTGQGQGWGTLNAHGVYDDGVLLTCYVLEYANEGKIDLKKWDQTVKPGDQHVRARSFQERATRDLDPELYANSWRVHGHLPAMPSPEKWEKDRPSTGDMIQRLWETVEVQAVHIAQLHERIKRLENQQG